MSRPTSVEPVKAIRSTSRCRASAWPASSPSPGTTLNTPGGHAGLAGQFAEADPRQRRLLGRLEHDAVAHQQRRSQLPAADDQRVVPRHDRPDHPERLAADEGEVIRAGRGHLVVELVGELGVVLDAVGAVGDIDVHRVGDGLADVAALEQGEVVDVGADQLGEAAQDALAFARLGAPPDALLEGIARAEHRRVHVRAPAARHRADDLAIDRADVLEHPAIARRDVAAVDEGAPFGLLGGGECVPAAPVALCCCGVHVVNFPSSGARSQPRN